MAGLYMFYTYVIQSLSHPDQRYIGHTADLRQRLTAHNARKCPHTPKFVPWKIAIYVAFESIDQAQHFEKYLKSGSGHVFAKRHFWSHGLVQNCSFHCSPASSFGPAGHFTATGFSGNSRPRRLKIAEPSGCKSRVADQSSLVELRLGKPACG